jgi:UDP-N-acetylmuramoyl-L-alanyl-D-glutamate--2,6-diaminopimelate ligase
MNLSSLLHALPAYQIENEREIEISQITSDSRQVTPGALFVAYPGVSVDGTHYIPQALERGAVAVVAEHPLASPIPCPRILVPDARAALAYLVAAWNDFPSRQLRVVGITGTDGKTTTCRLTAAILSAAGHRVGTITTVAATIGDQEIDTGFHTTTPDAPDVQRYLAQMVAAGMEYAVVESTSHGLAQQRLTAVEFDVAVVTNITHEHLDIHGTWENYRDAKARLFQSLTTSFRKPRTAKVAVLNADDDERGVFTHFQAIPADEQILYTVRPEIANLKSEIVNQKWLFARDVESSSRGLRFTVVTPHGELAIESPLIGRFNVSNILAAVGVGMARRIPFEAMRKGVASVQGVVGRMQVMQSEPFTAIVDFAHTPNALRVSLETARELARGRVIVVFGCAGLRDVQKRAWMGEVAGKLADHIVVTAEDPRTESLAAINAQIAEGLQRAGRRAPADYEIVDDRAKAIAVAMKMAQPGDLVIVTGKGHERSMCFGTTEYPWSDQETMEKFKVKS